MGENLVLEVGENLGENMGENMGDEWEKLSPVFFQTEGRKFHPVFTHLLFLFSTCFRTSDPDQN